MRALVTGGSGFIGAHLVPTLLRSGFSEVRVLDLRDPIHLAPGPWQHVKADISRPGEWHQALVGVDVVFHLAWASVPQTSVEGPAQDVAASLAPTVRLFELCVQSGVKRVVFLSSGGTVYGIPRKLPVTEEHPTEPLSAYGISKLAAEKFLKMFHRLYNLEFVILRPSVAYGEFQDPFGKQGAVSVFLGKIVRREPIVIWGQPDQIVRDFFYVGDLAKACVGAALSKEGCATYNIGGGRGVSLTELLGLLQEVVGEGYRGTFRINKEDIRLYDVPRLVLNCSKARRELAWQPEVDLRTGLRQTWLWIRGAYGSGVTG